MPVQFGSIASVQDETFNTSMVVPVPGGVSDGEMLALCVAFYDALAVLTSPAGWVQVGATQSVPTRNVQGAVFVKIAASEPADYTLSFDINTVGNAVIFRTTGNDPTSPPTPNGSGQVNASSTSVTAPSVTCPADSLAVFFGFHRFGSVTAFTPPAGYTERADMFENFASVSLEVATKEVSGGGVETPVGTLNDAAANGAFSFAIPATLAAAGGPPNMSPPQFGGWGAC